MIFALAPNYLEAELVQISYFELLKTEKIMELLELIEKDKCYQLLSTIKISYHL